MLTSSDDREMIYHLFEDVELFAGTLRQGLPKPGFVRSAFVPSLRRWIVEGDFHRVAKLLKPYEPKFEITTTPNDVSLCKAGVFDHWMAMTVLGGVGVGCSQLADKYRASPPERPHIVKARQKASAFFKQHMFFWKGQFYSRADVIGLHANKLGGVHLDPRRNERDKYIDEIRNYFGYEILPHTRQMLVGEDVRKARDDSARRDNVYGATELVAIDTADIFSKGILASRAAFGGILQ